MLIEVLWISSAMPPPSSEVSLRPSGHAKPPLPALTFVDPLRIRSPQGLDPIPQLPPTGHHQSPSSRSPKIPRPLRLDDRRVSCPSLVIRLWGYARFRWAKEEGLRGTGGLCVLEGYGGVFEGDLEGDDRESWERMDKG